jgi:hypothetical protein
MPHAITFLSVAVFVVSVAAALALAAVATMFAGALVIARAEQTNPPV